MRLFGQTTQETREEKGTLQAWENALYELGRKKAYLETDKRQHSIYSGYRDNPLDLLNWPTVPEMAQALDNAANQKEPQHPTQGPMETLQALLQHLVPPLEKKIRSYISPDEADRLDREQLIHSFLEEAALLHGATSYYLSLQRSGELAYANAKTINKVVSPQTIAEITEGPLTLPLTQWVLGLILRFSAPEATYYPLRPEQPPPAAPATAQLKAAANWINQAHLGLGPNLPGVIDALKRCQLTASQRGDTIRPYALEDLLAAEPAIQTLSGQKIGWQAWGFLPCPSQESKRQVLDFLNSNPELIHSLQKEVEQSLALRWLGAIASRGAINARFLEIEITSQEQTERSIIDPAREEANELAGSIPELQLIMASETAWRYFVYYELQNV